MLILLINLSRRPDRLAFMRNQLDALGLPFERIDAIDGAVANLGPRMGRITSGEHACALSHRKAWERFVESGAPHCLVMEDDALVAPQLKRFIENPPAFPPDMDILRLEATPQHSILGRGRRGGLRGVKMHRLHSKQHGTAAYMVTRAFAQHALKELVAFAAPIDMVLFDPASPGHYPSNTYQLRPGLCLQAEFYGPARSSALASSDLEIMRGPRPAPAKPAPQSKAQRSIAEKCLREVDRWARRSRRQVEFHYARIVTGRAWRDVPFIGTVLPVAAAALVPPDPAHRPCADATRPLPEPQRCQPERSTMSLNR
ncbi:glycosyltransferase family 25 protein [Xanthobacter autotrophicus]|uniref:glycosyltransferase family 25 protein n=1 Tax=Xanthobacter TaxID=279 RepID=UPI0024AAA822|nr:glycosyltransferase family 25 protein [Xanthobacter autotrophicus]MDI4666559.1 glycosyltransferase family 25 protein [Xanthobacter autotrophicus]